MIDKSTDVAAKQYATKTNPKHKIKKKYNNNEVKDFIKLIVATPDFANSCKQLYMFTQQDELRLVGYFKQNSDDRYGVDHINYRFLSDQRSYYITKNSFFADQRGADKLFSYDNIVLDIDKHDTKADYTKLDHEVDQLVYLLENDYDDQIPAFNVVKTGRGVHLWIHLNSFSSKLGFVYDATCRELCSRIDQIIKENALHLTVDHTASVNASGIVRLPYTYNQKRNGFKTTFEKRTDRRYSIHDLMSEFDIKLEEKPRKPKLIALDCSYSGLATKRIQFIERIVADNAGDCIGRRELLLFHYYNAATQLYKSESAEEMLAALNQAFVEPLPERDLREIKRSVAKVGYYSYTNEKFLSSIEASPSERFLYATATNRELERQKAREKKRQRNQKIKELAEKGYTQKEIAQKVGCSIGTVNKILDNRQKKQERETKIIELHEQGYSMREIAAKVGCAPNTVRNTLPPRSDGAEQERSTITLPPRSDGAEQERSTITLPPRSDGAEQERSTITLPPRSDGAEQERSTITLPPRSDGAEQERSTITLPPRSDGAEQERSTITLPPRSDGAEQERSTITLPPRSDGAGRERRKRKII